MIRSRRFRVVVLCLALAGCESVGQGIRVLTHDPSPEAAAAPAGTYRLDPAHQAVVFWVDHLQFSDYIARFNTTEATVDFVPGDPAASTLTATIDAASIDTGLAALDDMLTAPAMFDVADHPEFRFESTEIRLTGETTGTVTGDLTMAGRTRPFTLDVTFNGTGRDPLTGDRKLGFSATGSLERSDFGLGQWIPAVGDTVHFRIEAEFILAKDRPSS